jgi:hypothetical protein
VLAAAPLAGSACMAPACKDICSLIITPRLQPKQRKMARESTHGKEKPQGAAAGKTARAPAAVASSIAKPEFKKHIHTNNAKSKADDAGAAAGGEVLSRRQLKNLAKRRKKEAAAAAEASAPPSSSAAHAAIAAAPSAVAKAKKAPLDPGKKAEVNCNWQALKKALVSGGPIVTGSVHCSQPTHTTL